ncbi:MAG: hypothetical protein U0793_27870 [Gemmataceae bacterium]
MRFSEQPPSRQWAALHYKGVKFAEVWLKPEEEPLALTFRIPAASFQIPSLGRELTIENLLRAVAIEPEEVESWRSGDAFHAGMNGSNPEFNEPLTPPRNAHLEIHVRMSPASPSDAEDPELRGTDAEETDTLAVSSVKWQDLDARWKAILGLEASMEALRLSLEGLLAEMEASLRKTLTTEEKNHALRADVAQWTKAKSRVHNGVPKLKDVIHRCVWALGAPERKRLEAIYREYIQPRLAFPEIDVALQQLEQLQKDRQVLSGHAKTAYQEARAISAEVQGSLRTLQNNAVANAHKKNATGSKGGFFKKTRG